MKKVFHLTYTKVLWYLSTILWNNAFSKRPIMKKFSLRLFNIFSEKALRLNARYRLDLWSESE